MRVSKYHKFTNYLLDSNKKTLELTYSEIEELMGFMPKSALKYSGIWNDNFGSPFSKSWTNAGYSITNNFKEKKAVFTKVNNINIVIDAINRFHYNLKSGTSTRYKSWEYCYNIFKEKLFKKDCKDLLSLNLSWYLASWGMLRGSSFLLNYDYKIHYKIIEELSADEFKYFYDNPNEYNEELTDKAINIVKNGYYPNVPTDTLVTKILLGIFGCVPAYDTYFKDAVNYYNFSNKKFNIKSLRQMWKLYYDNKFIFDELSKKFLLEGIYYPPMKLIDMAFYQLGNELNLK